MATGWQINCSLTPSKKDKIATLIDPSQKHRRSMGRQQGAIKFLGFSMHAKPIKYYIHIHIYNAHGASCSWSQPSLQSTQPKAKATNLFPRRALMHGWFKQLIINYMCFCLLAFSFSFFFFFKNRRRNYLFLLY